MHKVRGADRMGAAQISVDMTIVSLLLLPNVIEKWLANSLPRYILNVVALVSFHKSDGKDCVRQGNCHSMNLRNSAP